MVGPVVGGATRLASAFALNPIQTARGALQIFSILAGASWIGFGFYGRYLATTHGEPDAVRTYDATGDSSPIPIVGGGGTSSPGQAAKEADTAKASKMADTGGGVDDWITDGLRYAGVSDNAENHAAMLDMIMGNGTTTFGESSGNPLAIQQIEDINSTLPGAGGFDDNLARGLTQITPQTWEANAPPEFKPAKDWIFKPRANVAVRALYEMAVYGRIIPFQKGGS